MFSGSFTLGKSLDRKKDPFTDEEATQFGAFTASDANIVSRFNAVDRLSVNIEPARRSEKLVDKDQINRCKSISLLCMQQYYFYWTLMLVFTNNFEK